MQNISNTTIFIVKIKNIRLPNFESLAIFFYKNIKCEIIKFRRKKADMCIPFMSHFDHPVNRTLIIVVRKETNACAL